ncbi:unnamed protein product [Ectocarpus sp. 13 AM-2016]
MDLPKKHRVCIFMSQHLRCAPANRCASNLFRVFYLGRDLVRSTTCAVKKHALPEMKGTPARPHSRLCPRLAIRRAPVEREMRRQVSYRLSSSRGTGEGCGADSGTGVPSAGAGIL